MRKLTIFILAFLSVVTSDAQEDSTVMYARDSAITSPTEATVVIFQGAEKVADPVKLVVVPRTGKAMSLATLLKTKEMTYADHALIDLDNDGKKELLIYNLRNDVKQGRFIDEMWLYKPGIGSKYQYAGKLMDGHVVLSPDYAFRFSFNEYFAEFYTCHDCGYTDQSDEAPIRIQDITVKYNKGKLIVNKGDQELRSIINDNLGKLGEKLTALSADGKDDGSRKEIANNLAVFYYAFGKNKLETQRLFNKYYHQADAKKIWAAILKQLQLIGSTNSF